MAIRKWMQHAIKIEKYEQRFDEFPLFLHSQLRTPEYATTRQGTMSSGGSLPLHSVPQCARIMQCVMPAAKFPKVQLQSGLVSLIPYELNTPSIWYAVQGIYEQIPVCAKVYTECSTIKLPYPLNKR